MKLYGIVLLILVSACAGKEVDKKGTTLESNCSLAGIEFQILEKVRAKHQNILTRSGEIPEPMNTLRKMDTSQISICPYYDFDVERFYALPSPEMLLECLSPSETQIGYVWEQDEQTILRLDVVKKEGEWDILKVIYDWQKVIAWLPEKLLQADSKSYRHFGVFGNEFIVYYRNQKPVYHTITGKDISGEEICQFIIDKMQNKGQLMEMIKTLKKKEDVSK